MKAKKLTAKIMKKSINAKTIRISFPCKMHLMNNNSMLMWFQMDWTDITRRKGAKEEKMVLITRTESN